MTPDTSVDAGPLAGSIATAAVADAFARISADGRPGIWIEVFDRDEALAAAADVDRRRSDGADLPLAGTTLAVKGNIDVGGHATTAGCPSFATMAPRSAPAVARLVAAGAVVVGITNLDQFATGLVGTRSPYGTCPNARWPELISGGSSSGSAVAVAAGLVGLALGTDTAGSGRVPAAANGIVGLKPTRGRCSTLGVVPACRSLDCVSFFAATVERAAVAARIVAGDPIHRDDPWRRAGRTSPLPNGRTLRIGIPSVDGLDFDGDPDGPDVFRSAVDDFVGAVRTSAPLTVSVVDPAPFLAAGRLLYEGAFVAERYAAVGEFVTSGAPDIDPIVGRVIGDGGSIAAWEVFRDLGELERLKRATEPVWSGADVIVVPSVPRLPSVAEVEADPIGTNTMLGTYTNFVNLLDLAALTVPVGPATADRPPTSLTLIGPAWSDEILVSLAGLIATP